MKIRQLDPVPAFPDGDFGYVAELGWREGPVYFPWVREKERDGDDAAASRNSYKNEGEAIAVAFALARGWSEREAHTLGGILARGPNTGDDE